MRLLSREAIRSTGGPSVVAALIAMASLFQGSAVPITVAADSVTSSIHFANVPLGAAEDQNPPHLDRIDTVTFTPGRINPGDALHIKVVNEDTITPPDAHCDGGGGAVTTEDADRPPLALWFLAQVDEGESIYGPALGTTINIGGDGITHAFQEDICPVHHEKFTTEFDISAESSANLTPGCYQTSGSNPQLVDLGYATGTVAVLTVGDTTECEGLQREALTLTGRYSYTGQLKGPLIFAAGTDSVAVEGSAAAIAQVVQTCVTSTWTVHAGGIKQSTLRFLWNEQSEPFSEDVDWRLDDTYSAKPKKGGVQILLIHGEVLSLTRCDPGAGRAYPALSWGGRSLTLLTDASFLDISHSITASATLADCRVIAVVVPTSSSGKKGVMLWSKEAHTTFSVTVP